MTQSNKKTMRAIAFDKFGGPEVLALKTLPVPEIGPDQILIKVKSAGVGKWDVVEREGFFTKVFPGKPSFPYVLGSEGAGTVVAVGKNVEKFKEGDEVYGHISARYPKNGFYAEFTPVDADRAWLVPEQLTTEQAGALTVDGATALRGLRDVLKVKEGERLMIFGASGGIGHMAIQLAKQLGARVLAIASGDDGVALAKRLGADAVVEGHTNELKSAIYEFFPKGPDAALFTAGGDAAQPILSAMPSGGRVAWPNGVTPPDTAPPDVQVAAFNSNTDAELMESLALMIKSGPFEVHISHSFPLEKVAEAQQMLAKHHIGRIALLP